MYLQCGTLFVKELINYFSSIDSVKKSALRVGLEAIIAGGITAGLYQLPSTIVENYYSNWIYRPIAGLESIIGDALPFSIIEGLVVLCAGTTAYAIGAPIVKLIKKLFTTNDTSLTTPDVRLPTSDSRPATTDLQPAACNYFLNSLLLCSKAAAITMLALTLLGGLNNNRISVVEKAGLQQNDSRVDLQGLVYRINRSKQRVAEFRFDKSALVPEINASINNAYALVNKTVMPGPYKIKEPHVSLRSVNLGGVTLASFESLVDCDEKDYSTVWVMGHEKAHTKGYVHEADAEALNYLACVSSGNDVLEYSALLHLFFISIICMHENSPEEVENAIKLLNTDTVSELRSFAGTINDESKPRVKAARYFSDLQQKIRGDNDSVNAYLTKTFSALWAVDTAYREGKFRK